MDKIEDYLGDGVYAEYDGMIRLYTMEGNEIYLEREVYQALMKFGQRTIASD